MHLVEANGAHIPAIGLGTWTLKDEHCADIVETALRGGYRHVDTAAMYDNEKAVGTGLKRSGVGRDEVFVTTKVWYTDIADGKLQRSAKDSLARLALDDVDLLLIHWPSSSIPIAESIGALNDARLRGLTRHIGVSNFPSSLLEQAIALSDAPIVCNQIEFHPYLNQSKVHGACDKAGLAKVSYCPLGRGGGLFGEEVIVQAAKNHSRTPGQIILRWHVQQHGVVAIPRTTKPERLAENADIFDFELEASEMSEISGLSRRNERICDFAFSPLWDAA